MFHNLNLPKVQPISERLILAHHYLVYPWSGAASASKATGGDFSNLWWSRLITASLLWEGWSILRNTAVTKQKTTKWPLYRECYFPNCTKSWL